MRLIDADALLKALVRKEPFNDCARVVIAECMQEVRHAPTIEPERKTGKWIYGEHDVAMCDGYRCDKCGFFIPWDYKHKFIDFIKDYKYCPHCGAQMTEAKNDKR